MGLFGEVRTWDKLSLCRVDKKASGCGDVAKSSNDFGCATELAENQVRDDKLLGTSPGPSFTRKPLRTHHIVSQETKAKSLGGKRITLFSAPRGEINLMSFSQSILANNKDLPSQQSLQEPRWTWGKGSQANSSLS